MNPHDFHAIRQEWADSKKDSTAELLTFGRGPRRERQRLPPPRGARRRGNRAG